MSEFRVNTDIIRKGASVLSSAATSMQQIVTRINNLGNQIEGQYQGQLREKVVPILSAATGGGNPIQMRSQEISAGLSAKAKAIDDAMESNFNRVANAYTSTSWSGSLLQDFFNSIGQFRLEYGAFVLRLGLFGTIAIPVMKSFGTFPSVPNTIAYPLITKTPNLKPNPIPLNDGVKPETFSPIDGCALYAQKRRNVEPYALGPTNAVDGGAAGYIDKFKSTAFQIPQPGSGTVDLHNIIAKGYTLVWPRNVIQPQGSPGWTYGHVAIVEEVGSDYVIVSQAGWGNKSTMKVTLIDFEKWNLWLIP